MIQHDMRSKHQSTDISARTSLDLCYSTERDSKIIPSPMTQALTWDVGSWVFILFPADILFSQSRTSSVLERGAKTYMIKPL